MWGNVLNILVVMGSGRVIIIFCVWDKGYCLLFFIFAIVEFILFVKYFVGVVYDRLFGILTLVN